MDIKKYINKIIKDEDTKNSYLKLCTIEKLNDDQKVYLMASILRQIEEREEDTKHFAEHFEKIYNSKLPIRETILLCHMAIEHFLGEHLKILLPNYFNIKGPRLNFMEKLYICSATVNSVGAFYNEIKLINNLRNNFAHNPMHEVLDDALNPLKENIWIRKIVPEIESIEENSMIIELSCRAICSIIDGIIKESLRKKRDDTYPSYKQFI